MRITKSLKKGTLAGTTMLASLLLMVGCSGTAPIPGGDNGNNGNNNGGIENPIPNPGTSGSSAQEACTWVLDAMGKIDAGDADGTDIEEYIRSLNTITSGYNSILGGIQNGEVKAAFSEFAEGWEFMAKYLTAAMKGDYNAITGDVQAGMEKFSTGAEKLFELCGLTIPTDY